MLATIDRKLNNDIVPLKGKNAIDPYENVSNLVHRGNKCHSPGCRGYGTIRDGVMFIGIAPGRDEVVSGRPFTGQSGLLLDGFLKSVGFPRSRTYATNLICWWKDDPNAEEAARCSDRLMHEIRELEPKLIIPMGGIVTEIMTGHKVGKIRGACQWSTKFNAYVMPTYHPAAILRSGSGDSAYKGNSSNFAFDLYRDLLKIPDVLKWEPNSPKAQVTYSVVKSQEAAQAVLDALPKLDSGIPVAIDVETTSLSVDEIDVFVNDFLCLSVSTGVDTWVFPGISRDWKLNWPMDVRWTFHNGIFDSQVIRRIFGVWLPIVEDTMLVSYSIDERPGYHSLKPLAREYLGTDFYEEKRAVPIAPKGKKALSAAALKKQAKAPFVEGADLYTYNAKDGAYTARILDALKPKQESEGTRGMYESILIPALNVFKETQYHGVTIDVNRLKHFAKEWGGWYLKLEEELQEMAAFYGWPNEIKGEPINLNSPQQIAKFLYDILALPQQPGKRGRGGQTTGQRSTSEDTLKLLENMHPFVPKLMEFRHLHHMYVIYIINLIKNIKPDNKIHPTVKLYGTATGRPAYTDPPIQTIPQSYMFEDTFGLLRQMFIPSTPDHVIVEADYGKAEVWMAYQYSRDPQLLADLMSGDYHTSVAADVLGKPTDQVTSSERREFKTVNFGVMYSREAASLAASIQRTVPEAQSFIDGYFEHNAEYAKYFKDTERKAQKDGELVTLTGRKRRFMFIGQSWDYRALKQAVNNNIQSTSSDCILSSIIEIHPRLKAINERMKAMMAHILFSVHDSIVFEVHRGVLHEVLTLIHEVMVAPRFPGIVSIPVEFKVGTNWWNCKEVHSCEKPIGESCLYNPAGITAHVPKFHI